MDDRTSLVLGKLPDSLTEWLNEFFWKKPLVEIKLKTMVNQIPKDLRKTFLNRVSVFSWVAALLRPARERRN
jgi:hypothetical protein